MKTSVDSKAADFLPDALAIRHAPLPWWGRCLIGWMAAFFVAAVIWACIGRVDVIVAGSGKLVSNHPTIVMKPLERTVIKEILVAVGDRVRQDQALATFDPVFSRADAERLLAEVAIQEALFARLLAEFQGTIYTAPPNPTEEAGWQESIFRERRAFYTQKMEYFTEEIARIEKTYASLEANLAIQRNRLTGFRDIEKMLETTRTLAVSSRELKEVQLSRMQLESEISDKENNMRVLTSERLAKMAERDSFVTDWSIEVAKEMVQARTSLTRARKEYEKALQMTSYVALRAPQDAVVHEIAPIAVESAVREAEPIITLVPVGGVLEVEARIRAEDIGKVHPGAPVRVKISAFPFQQYGTLNGTVRVLSEDAFSDERQEGPRQEAPTAAFYRARITLDTAGDTTGIAARLIPGMEAQAEIRVYTRRIIEYLTHPIIKSFDEAIREP